MVEEMLAARGISVTHEIARSYNVSHSTISRLAA
jgi:transposase-like protein